MRYHQITAIWEEELFENDLPRMRDGVEDDLRDSMDHFEFRNLRIDVIPLPIKPPVHGFSNTTNEPEEAQVQIIPDAGVVHPWDEGKWIFPEDHPLAVYERNSKVYGEAREKQAFLEAGQKMLPRGSDE